MNETVIVAIISLLGTLFGTMGGIVASGKLISFRIEQLEKRVESMNEKHDGLIDRVFRLEEHGAVIDEQIKVANKRILDLEHHEEARANDGK